MSDVLLVINAGSSSLKFAVFVDAEPPQRLLGGSVEALRTQPRFTVRDAIGEVAMVRQWPAGATLDHRDAIEFLLDWARNGALAGHRIVAVGHRVVHGGMRFSAPVLVDGETLAQLAALAPLAPLHQLHNVSAIETCARLAPGVPQVACFDTAFHRTQPDIAQAFALPTEYADRGIRRYGFHGLSCENVASTLAQIDPRAAAGRTVVAHLGNGASLCALHGECSVATTMGFSALDGLMMGTRCGAIDPGVLLYLLDHDGMSCEELRTLLYEQSGLLGVSGMSSDMRTLLASTDPRARRAIDLFVYRAGRELGSLAAALGGLDALVFTGGIGEHSPPIRARICRDAAWLGVQLDDTANRAGGPRINHPHSQVSVWVIPANEEEMIARHTRLLAADTRRPVWTNVDRDAVNGQQALRKG